MNVVALEGAAWAEVQVAHDLVHTHLAGDVAALVVLLAHMFGPVLLPALLNVVGRREGPVLHEVGFTHFVTRVTAAALGRLGTVTVTTVVRTALCDNLLGLTLERADNVLRHGPALFVQTTTLDIVVHVDLVFAHDVHNVQRKQVAWDARERHVELHGETLATSEIDLETRTGLHPAIVEDFAHDQHQDQQTTGQRNQRTGIRANAHVFRHAPERIDPAQLPKQSARSHPVRRQEAYRPAPRPGPSRSRDTVRASAACASMSLWHADDCRRRGPCARSRRTYHPRLCGEHRRHRSRPLLHRRALCACPPFRALCTMAAC